MLDNRGHPELVSGSPCYKGMLKQVQHDRNGWAFQDIYDGWFVD